MNGNICRRRLRMLAGTLAVMGLPGTAWAEPAPPFSQLFRQTESAPQQIAIEAEVERARGVALQARARPNPTLSALTENFGGQRPYTSFDRAESTLQLNQPIEIGGKRGARIAVGQASIVAAEARGVEGRLNYAHDLARAYAGAEISDRRVALAEDVVEQAQEDLRVARALVSAGKEARLRSLQAETEVNALLAELETARAHRVGAYALLSALAGVETRYTSLADPFLDKLDAKPVYGPIDPLKTASYLTAQADREAAARRATLVRRQAIPDITASLGVRRFEAEKANALLVGVTVPFPVFDRNRGNIAAAQAELRGANAKAAAALLEAQARVEAALALNDAADARAAAAERTLATATEAYRLSRIAYQAGKSPLIELLSARHELGVARGVVLDAVSARLDARAELARLEGRTITGEIIQ